MPEPPYLSELRIVLLGTNVHYTNRLANILLGRESFQTEAVQCLIDQHCQRVSGLVERRTITIINAPHLYNPKLSQKELIQKVKECITLSDPGPHVFLLVLQSQNLTKEHNDRIISTLYSYIPQSINRLLLVTTAEEHGFFSSCISECEMKHYRIVNLSPFNKHQVLQLLKKIDVMVTENGGDHMTCTINEPQERKNLGLPRPQDQDYSLETLSTDPAVKRKQLVQSGVAEGFSTLTVLNLVLCGSDELKSSISDLILKQTELISDPRSECLMRKGVVSGYQVTLVETPTLYNTQLSEEEVMRETLHCVSLCNPGVHAFIIIIPVGPLQDEDKAEIKLIQRIFSSRMNDHTIVLFSNRNTDETAAINFIKQSSETEELLSMCSDRYIMLQKTESERLQQVPALLDQVKKMATTNEFYCLLMYVKAQRDKAKQELEKKLSEKEEKNKQLQKLLHRTCADGESPDSGSLRMVLIGKTGNGKSATGNTILGRKEFHCSASMTSATTICQKGFGEVKGKSIAVVDTPGLFDTTLSNEEAAEEIVKCISLSAPGPHAFIIVLSVGRSTQEELETLSLIKKMFGTEAAKFTIVLFTHGDKLEDQTLEEYIKNSNNRSIDKLIRDCGGRVHVFNNREKNDRTQVHDLIRMIEGMIKSDRNNYFTNQMFEAAEISIQQKQQEILKEKEEQMQAEKEALKNKYEEELEKIRKGMETDKEKLEQERCEREKVFKEREEALRREFIKKEEEDQKRSEEDKRQKAENDRMLEEMRKEMEKQNATILKQQAEKDEEDRRRAEREKIERGRFEHEQKEAMEKLQIRQQEEIKKRDEEEQKRRKEQEEKQENWRRKMKEAENDKMEIKDDIERKLKEQEMEWKEKMRAREEEHKRTKEKHDKEVKEQKEKQEQIRRNFEKERENEIRKREKQREQWKEAERREREQREREYEEYIIKMKKEYEEREIIRKEEWERRTSEDNERREEDRQRIKRLKEEIERERQEEIKRREKEDRDRREKEEREHEEMKKNYEKKELDMKSKYEDEARRQAEQFNDVKAQLEKRIEELITKHQMDYELLNELYRGTQKEYAELKQSKEEMERKLRAEGESPDSGSLRIVLFGKTGNGKSATGNTILGHKEFQCSASMTSVTTMCQKGFGEVEGKSIVVVDTPGLFDTTLSNEEAAEEIVKCISLSAPGPHTFIIVLSVGRITQEELETLSLIKKMFGADAAKFTIVLFTRGDDLEDQTLEEYILKKGHKSMNKLIRDCGGRIHVFNNKEKNDRTQVHDLIRMIEGMIKSDRNNYFTNEMFEAAENSIQQKQQEILKEKEELKAEKEALKNKYEEEFEKIRKSMETEKEKLEREKVFKEREEALRREFEKKEEEEKEKRRLEDLRRSEEDERQKAENDRMLEEMRKEMENQNATFLKQQAEKDEEDRRRAEREKIERKRFEREQKEAMEKLQIRQQEEIKKRDEEEQKRKKEQEEEQEHWRRKMKEAENDKKEIKDDIQRKLREREMEWKEKMRAREEEHKRTNEKHDKEVKEQEEKHEEIRRNFEKEREDETCKREEEREQWKEAERREREQREREYEQYKLKMKKEYEERERIRKEEWERRISEDNERREEVRQRIKRLKEEIERERQEEIKRREKEEREREEMKKNYEKKELDMKSKYEDEARRHAEQFNDVKAQLENRIEELITKHQMDYELFNELYRGTQKEYAELKQSKEETERELREQMTKMECTIA